MSDEDSEHAPARIPPKPARESSHRPLRPRDSMGALRPAQAQIDEAHARGYAEGLAEARADASDALRTLLVELMEARFGQLEERAMDCIAEADDPTLRRWIVAASKSPSADDVFGA